MNDLIRFKKLEEQVLKLVAEIYNYYIEHSTAIFHTTRVKKVDLQQLIPLGHGKYVSFLIYYNDVVAGYCYLGQYKNRPAYDRTAEVTIYLHHAFWGKGIARKAMLHLEKVAREKNICVLLGIITGENVPSVKLFERMGYEKCAHFKQIGEKFGRLLDVVAYQKLIDL
ncbi:GNAT family N-acetyltransferase [uncultured Draconibacterium sp.]|uniref:GNAT family N-acetyltransferase n=1 Tax=uncultured Draconibacterium sp. TaxID=1573823 RepID=UPI0025F3B965|nr:GNAT family N-acetyltransferase [uncultured Draconibacterium sp.]